MCWLLTMTIDLTGLAAGDSKYAADVVLPAGVTLISDPKMIVVHLSERSTAVEEVAAYSGPGLPSPITNQTMKQG